MRYLTAENDKGLHWGLLVALLFALAQLPGLPIGNVNWDGWVHFLVYVRGNGDWIVQEFFDNGRPINGWMMLAAFDALGARYGTLVVSICCLGAATLFAYGAAARCGFLAAREAALVALFIGINPADQMMLSSSSLHFFTAYAALFAALYAGVCAERARNSFAVTLWEVLSLALACFAAATGDSIAFLMPALAWVRLAMLRNAQPGGWKNALAIARRLLAPGAASLAFIAHFLVFPPSADFAAERTVGLGLLASLELLARFAVVLAVAYAPVWLAAAALSQHNTKNTAPWHPRAWSGLAWLVLALFILALAPYWLADRKPTITGWSVRFLFTMGPALGLACVLWIRTAALRTLTAPRLVLILASSLVLAYLARWPFWFERMVKDDAVVAYSRSIDLLPGPQAVCIFDQNPSIARPYRSMEWTGILQWGSGRADVVALQPVSLARTGQELEAAGVMLKERYPLLNAQTPTQCSYDILIPEPRADWPVTVVLASLRRFISAPAEYDHWLLGRYAISGRPSR